MNSNVIRNKFLDFFESKGHKIVPSAPIVVKNDPTLMFTNAGMNQFKDYFLGNKAPEATRVADSQKCLRVSGKHNDLEEVGVDTYHHTMFEMLGNWSFGDYFKKESIQWAWELLTKTYGLDPNRMYVTVFEGSEDENLEFDQETYQIWKNILSEERILKGNKKDNFWEMGETGPCGPSSEIHFDLRNSSERLDVPGHSLVNMDHPQVIEIWNLVFIQYNRKSDGSLEPLPQKHVDTGMGFERLVRAVHSKHSNYDTDVFMDLIQQLEQSSGKHYEGSSENKTDIAFRVISDHIRAIAFTIADGQLPSNTGAGYVIRRILRRAVRYGYSYLDLKQPFLSDLVDTLALKFESVFPELDSQKDFVKKAILEEERSFLSTLSKGLDILYDLFKTQKNKIIEGKQAFELYDTFGFPLDLTRLIASENQFRIDEEGFKNALDLQKQRSKKDAEKITGDWTLTGEAKEQHFLGYTRLESESNIQKYRTITVKGKPVYHLVLDQTPFYAESGGQVGDTGILTGQENDEIVQVLNTLKENNLSIHVCDRIPKNTQQVFKAKVNRERRERITKNHSATHLLHSALKQVLGDHVAQKGSLVDPDRLRFDFSHFSKITDDELNKISELVNEKISEHIRLEVLEDVPIKDALEMGAMALFGEKYGEKVRVIIFDPKYSIELCGGTHVKETGEIERLILTSESSVAAGVRRIEAITGPKANEYLGQKLDLLNEIEDILGHPKDLVLSLKNLISENTSSKKTIQSLAENQSKQVRESLLKEVADINGFNSIIKQVDLINAEQLKDICFHLKNSDKRMFAFLGTVIDGKPMLALCIGDELLKEKELDAGKLIRDWAKMIDGGGGGQAFFATAGGKKTEGLKDALKMAKNFLENS
ncbi:MAG: alanine--tRNA ligase [Flavobacteriales bacterium]|nr:alanine--tRNA ligase [Flavobacteriales bacterium]